MNANVEILAPAGTEASAFAALRAGADAVYFGLDSGFNARARAENIALRELSSLMTRIHDLGRRGYLTLNTLIFDGELERFAEILSHIAEAAVDAVIVQDLGVARWVKATVPTLRLHASTQMTCTDLSSVKLAHSLGASRVTMARELSLSDITSISKESPIELEVFVHGALCIAYSGQCLTSEAIGGRSANRGACAQACRLPYDLYVDGVRRELGEKAYLLSPKDLDLSGRLPELVASGVRAIKIEGRLKSTDYVTATTHLYRRALEAALGNGAAPSALEHEASTQTFSRGSSFGFFEGTNHQALVDGRTCDHIGVYAGTCEGTLRQGSRTELLLAASCSLRRGDGLLVRGYRSEQGEFGGRIWALSVDGIDVEQAEPGRFVRIWFGPDKSPGAELSGREVYRTSSPKLLESIERELGQAVTKGGAKLGLRATLSGAVGQAPKLELLTEDGRRSEVVLDCVLEAAQNRPLDEASAFEKIGKLGETPFRLTGLDFKLTPGTTLPISSLNRARRDAVDRLGPPLQRKHAITASLELDSRLNYPQKAELPRGLFVTCRNLEQASAAIAAGADGIYLDFLALTGLGPAVRKLREQAKGNVKLGIALPRIRKVLEEKIDRFVLGLEPDLLLVRSLGTLFDLESSRDALANTLLIADFSLNVTNTLTAIELLARGVDGFTPSYDLDAEQLPSLLHSELAPHAEVVIHHPMPLFHMEHCVIAALLSSGKDYRECGRPCDSHQLSLRDRKGVLLPVEADIGCRNTVFHGKSQSAADQVPALLSQGVGRFRIELVREDAKTTEILVQSYRELLSGQTPPARLREHLGKAGLSAVRGSLRIIG